MDIANTTTSSITADHADVYIDGDLPQYFNADLLEHAPKSLSDGNFAKQPTDGGTNFFRLPRELRDKIYEGALTLMQKYPSQHYARLRGRRVPDLALLLVSRQFALEVMEAAEHESSLVVLDREDYMWEPLKLPDPLHFVTKLEVHLAIPCTTSHHRSHYIGDRCKVVKELRSHRKWIVDLSEQMKGLKEIHMKLMLDPHRHVDSCERELLTYQGILGDLAERASFEVYLCRFMSDETAKWFLGRENVLAMTWSARNGLERVRPMKREHVVA